MLYDDIGSMLDVLHLHSKDVQSGEQFETDRFQFYIFIYKRNLQLVYIMNWKLYLLLQI